MDFPPTEWSLIVNAGESPDGSQALERLCRDYWRPVRDFLRMRGWSYEEAEDATQEFFKHLAMTGNWARADRARGRFRTFLLGMLMRSLSRNLRKKLAEKRGGGMANLSLEGLQEQGWDVGSERIDAEDMRSFDEEWAAHVMENALARLSADFGKRGKALEFEALSVCLPVGSRAGGVEVDYELIAQQQGMTQTALRTAISRLRKQFKETVEREISRTVSDPQEVAEELRYLCAVLARPGFGVRSSGSTSTQIPATSEGLAADSEE